MDKEYVVLSRDTRATLLPSELEVLLAKDNAVKIDSTDDFGYRVEGVFGAAKIAAADADALGIERPKPAENSLCAANNAKREYVFSDTPAGAAVDIDEVWGVAKTVFDPEIPVNIVDLGLVYRIEVVDGDRVEVDMTLTAPGCSMGPVIADDLRVRIEALPAVREAVVNIVWDPPWNQDMMSEEARMILGIA